MRIVCIIPLLSLPTHLKNASVPRCETNARGGFQITYTLFNPSQLFQHTLIKIINILMFISIMSPREADVWLKGKIIYITETSHVSLFYVYPIFFFLSDRMSQIAEKIKINISHIFNNTVHVMIQFFKCSLRGDKFLHPLVQRKLGQQSVLPFGILYLMCCRDFAVLHIRMVHPLKSSLIRSKFLSGTHKLTHTSISSADGGTNNLSSLLSSPSSTK